MEDPFQISNVDQLQNVSANRSAHYMLVADVDASATETWGNGAGFAPIGNTGSKFYGTFRGNGHMITNLTINRSTAYGVALFGGLARGSWVEDLTLVDPRVHGSYYVGTVAGFSEGRVYGCSALNVTVMGTYYVGGMVGFSNWISEMDCHVTGRVKGTEAGGLISEWKLDDVPSGGSGIGGMIGYKSRGWMSGCSAEVEVEGGDRIGGLVGQASLSNVTDCRSVGDVTGLDYEVGGLMGSYSGSQSGIDSYGYMTSCSHAGEVTGLGSVGGLLGANWGGALEDCHHSGTVSGTENVVGGLVGDSYGSYGRCWAVGDVSGTGSVGGMFGQHTSPTSGGGPIVAVMVMADMYHIGDVTGTDYYVGGFAGQISQGYLARCNASGDVSGNSNVGGFAGMLNSGSLEDCTSAGTVTATGYDAGGFIGFLGSGGIDRCYSSADVTGYSSVGGLVGNVDRGSVRESHSSGVVTGTWGVGGLIANNDGYVYTSYSTGRVSGTYGASGLVAQGSGSVYYSYWDMDTSGTTRSQGGGLPRTTAQMKMQSTFVGWDFSTVWNIIESVSYPFLRTVHHAPFVVPLGEEAAYEERMLSLDYDINISKYPRDNVQTVEQFSTNAGPWLSYDPANDRLNGTPSTDDIGVYWIDITVIDSYGGTTDHNVTFEVKNVNDAPTILTSPLGVATEDQEYSVDYVAMDIDPTNDTLVWRLETEAGWLTINATTGVLNGTPTNDDVGTWNVTVTVADGKGGLDLSKFILVVDNVNDAPVMMTDDVTEATEDEEYSVTYEALDVDPTDDDLEWTYMGNAPWLTWDGTTLHGTPSNDDVGSFWVGISVSDGIGGEDHTNFTITVVNVNDAPVMTTVAQEEATEDAEYRLALTAEDIDEGDTLTWELVTAPTWLSMEGGDLVGTPENDDVGPHQVEVEVSDEAGERDILSFTITVINSNDAPVWAHVPEDMVIVEGEPVLLYVLARDDDVGDTIGYGISMEHGEGIHIDNVRGTIYWFDTTPGVHSVEVSATDGTAPVHHTFTIDVKPFPNEAPKIDAVSDRRLEVNETLTLTATGSDGDRDALVFRLEAGPAGMVMNPEGLLVWTPRPGQVGNHTVEVSLSDGRESVETQFKVTVTPPPPVDETPAGDQEEEGGSDLLLLGVIVILLLIVLVLIVIIIGKGHEGEVEAPTPGDVGPIMTDLETVEEDTSGDERGEEEED